MPSSRSIYSPNWSVRCISVPGPDTDLALFVHFDNARYLIGSGEGTQRAFAQKKVGFRWLQAVLLPSADTRTRAGLPGVIMTAADAAVSQLNVIGPPDTAHYLSTFRSSVVRDKFVVDAVTTAPEADHHTPTVVHTSASITISAITLIPPPLRVDPGPSTSTSLSAWSTGTTPAFTPDLHSTRPTRFTPPEIAAWRSSIVRDIFGRFASSSASSAVSDLASGSGSTPRVGPSSQPLPHFAGHMFPSWPDQRFVLPLPTLAEQAADMVYLLQAPEVRGAFNVAKAKALNVPNGPIRGRLTKGETVEFDDPTAEGGRRTVRPEECMEGGGPGPALIVVSCSVANLPTLLDSRGLDRYRPSRDSAVDTECQAAHSVVHRVAREVWEDERYAAWVETFGSAKHLVAFTDQPTDDIYFRSSAWNATQLHAIDPEMFYLQQVDSTSASALPAPALAQTTTLLKPNHKFQVHPSGPLLSLDPNPRDQPLPRDLPSATASALARVQDEPALRAAIARGRELNAQYVDSLPGGQWNGPGADIRVTTLGTGSAIPSKYRNVSGTMLEVPGLKDGRDGMILLDAGEGTLGQMRRLYGVDGMRGVYERLRMVFVSHMHADHHLGMQAILHDRFEHGFTDVLYVVGPPHFALAMQESASWQAGATDEALGNVLFVNSPRMTSGAVWREDVRRGGQGGETEAEEPGEVGDGEAVEETPPSTPGQAPKWLRSLLPRAAPVEWGVEDRLGGQRRWPLRDVLGWSEDINFSQDRTIQRLLSDLDLLSMQCVQVPHRGYATALVIRHASGWKTVYSGDTRPSDALVRAGKGATVLIHEATIEDDKPETAEQKGHSTFGQAIDVGRRMGARHVLLNHFSQRYPKLPNLRLNVPGPGPEVAPEAAPHEPKDSASAVSAESSQPTLSDGVVASQSPREPIVAISFDFMSVRVGDMYRVANYLEAIGELYRDDEDEGEEDVEVSASALGGATGKGQGAAPSTPVDGQAKGKGKKGKVPKGAGVNGTAGVSGIDGEGRAAKRPSEESVGQTESAGAVKRLKRGLDGVQVGIAVEGGAQACVEAGTSNGEDDEEMSVNMGRDL